MSGVSGCGVVVDEGHEVSFGRFWEHCCMNGVDKEFQFEKGLVLVVVVSLV